MEKNQPKIATPSIQTKRVWGHGRMGFRCAAARKQSRLYSRLGMPLPLQCGHASLPQTTVTVHHSTGLLLMTIRIAGSDPWSSMRCNAKQQHLCLLCASLFCSFVCFPTEERLLSFAFFLSNGWPNPNASSVLVLTVQTHVHQLNKTTEKVASFFAMLQLHTHYCTSAAL